jgi:hypothetical protein
MYEIKRLESFKRFKWTYEIVLDYLDTGTFGHFDELPVRGDDVFLFLLLKVCVMYLLG